MAEHLSETISKELGELFDLKKAKLRNEKQLTQEATEAQKDIRLVTLMFRDGIPDLELEIGSSEKIIWDSKSQVLIYHDHDHDHGHDQLLEGASREIRIKVRPFLKGLVKKAKELYI